MDNQFSSDNNNPQNQNTDPQVSQGGGVSDPFSAGNVSSGVPANIEQTSGVTNPASDDSTNQNTPTSTSGGFASFKKEEDKKKPFDPASPVTGTLGATEEEILGGSKNIFGRPISYDGEKPKDARGQFEFVLNIKIPENNLDFDEQKFRELLAGSISLLFEEKMEIINTISKINQDQINKLIEILEDEQKKFKELTEKHKEEMTKKKQEEMEAKMKSEQEFLKQEESTKSDDLQQAEDLLNSLGM